MEHIKASGGIKRKNSEACTAIEYGFDDEKNINSAVIELNGRYPETGFALNTVCEEVLYVIEGSGQLVGSQTKIIIETGDMLRIKPNEKYYFDGNLKLLISSSPAWYPEQYQNV
jgi:mannose-6-phosphate isomerase-like protein (cupin superfamily)